MSAKKANALAGEKSPYLLQHAYNPVEWLPWGEEAFRRAREEEKPIFLSVGYSTCHWCHVMEEESFENEKTARLMNEHFINVKVDREERPDVDLMYMTFVQASTGQGGWPMNVWLTPELKPFIGGTYFPPDDRQGRASFPRVIERVAEVWETKRDEVLKQGDDIVDALREQATRPPEGGDGEGQWEDVFAKATEQIERSFDAELGGFSSAPKFPRPVLLNLVFRLYEKGKAGKGKEHGEMLKKGMRTLSAMANGGMYDQLGGGFHGYSVDRYWHVPHFEKMLYDQAQLAISYLESFQITGKRECREVAEEIFEYVLRDMRSSEGGFYSAEDADSYFDETKTAHGEGAFYVWGWEELEAVLGRETREMEIFAKAYGAAEGGNVRPESDPMKELVGKNVLYRKSSDGQLAEELGMEKEEVKKSLEESRARLLEARSKRPRPHLDDKIITAWNGLMISAFARGHVVLGEEKYRKAAVKAAEFVRDELVERASGVLLRSYREGPGTVPGFASDYAFFIQALLDLYGATFEVAWLEEAIELQEMFDALYYDGTKGGYMSVSETEGKNILSIKEEHDGAEPAPNSVAVLNLLRLSNLMGEARWRERAGAILGAARPILLQMPIGMPQMAVALDYVLGNPAQVVIMAGEDYAEKEPAMLAVVRKGFRPWQTVIVLRTGTDREFFGARSAALKAMEPIEGKTAAYVCEDFVCQRPVTEAGELEGLLGE